MGAYSKQTDWTDRVNDLIVRAPMPKDGATQPQQLSPSDHTRTRSVVRKLRDDEVTQLILGYQEGASVYTLAERFKIHRTTVSGHLHRAGVAMRRQGLNAQQADAAVDLHLQGWSLGQLGRHLGVDPRVVDTAIRSRGYNSPRP